MEPTASDSPTRVRCPHCGRLTDQIQVFEYPVVLFAFVYVAWSWSAQRVFGCPPCVRRQLRVHALVSVVMANVLCWIPVPAILMSIWSSYTRTRPDIPPEYEYLAQLPPLNVSARDREARARQKRLLVVVLILAVVACCLVFLLPALAGRR